MTVRTRATLVGLTAILMWAALATLGTLSGKVPPFLLNALTFGLSGTAATVWLASTGRLGVLRQPAKVWALGAGGLFGFHALYFAALRLAPPVEASLVCYLWPLLIVVFSGLLPGEKLKPHHVIGALLGLVGAAAVVTKGRALSIDPAHVAGYLCAAGAAVFWAGYSVLSRSVGAVPTAAVAGFCLATAVLSALCHVAFETTVWPAGAVEWGAVVALAIFPVGLAFFVWDHGVKRGDIQVLGAASYMAPLLSTLIMIAVGLGRFEPAIAVAALAITAGAVVASKDMLKRAPAASTPEA